MAPQDQNGCVVPSSVFSFRDLAIVDGLSVESGLFGPRHPRRHPLRDMPALGKGPRHHPWQERPKQNPEREAPIIIHSSRLRW